MFSGNVYSSSGSDNAITAPTESWSYNAIVMTDAIPTKRARDIIKRYPGQYGQHDS